jgi:hypothetical protein
MERGNPEDLTQTITQTLPLNWTPGMLKVSIPYESVRKSTTMIKGLLNSVADPDPGGSGMDRKSASGSGIRDEQPGSYFIELKNHFLVFFGLYLNSLMRIRDGDSSDPGWKKVGSGIRNTDFEGKLSNLNVL